MKYKNILSFSLLLISVAATPFLRADIAVNSTGQADSLQIAANGESIPVWVDSADWWGVTRAAGDLCDDVQRVTGVKPDLIRNIESAPAKNVIIVGTLGKSALINQLAKSGKIDGSKLEGRWEAFQLTVVDSPLPGVDRAFVIAGSDKRGTIFGIYTLSAKIGVSPWYWWADVPAQHHDALYVLGDLYDDGPTVKYRGIFLNDEAPALSGWANEKFGGLNHEFYSHVFELILRLKGNYLWPAMWNNAFNEDDPENPRLADAYGVVMGTSHHEPMIRAQKEWWHHGTGPWNYEKNGEVLRKFWADGIARNKDFESIVTMGMRGDGDMAMSESTNVALLEKIVDDQRAILERETGKKASEIPQLWALYKEVQDYYEHGMRVPDDVTLLWCDDNWGNIRRLPRLDERKRSGGAGLYYHFDYVGGPRSYKWLNTIPLTKVWQQLNMAWQYDDTRIWIVNVGDLKPLEYPISFFMDYAWDPETIPYDNLHEYTVDWAAQQFGSENSEEIAGLLEGYTQLNALRKPEMLSSDTYSVVNYSEAGRILDQWKKLEARSNTMNGKLAENQKDAFYELVDYPILACANLNEMYISAGYNMQYARQGRAGTNGMADLVKACFDRDAELANCFNTVIAGGKWNHMMDQKHIGWTYWQQPPMEVAPAVSYVHPLPAGAIGVALEGSNLSWPENDMFQPKAVLPAYTPDGSSVLSFEVFNRSTKPVDWTAKTSVPWLHISKTAGSLNGSESRTVILTSDANSPSSGIDKAVIDVEGIGPNGPCTVSITLPILQSKVEETACGKGFIETGKSFAFNACDYQQAVAGDDLKWDVLSGYAKRLWNPGDAGNAITALPVLHDRITPGGDSPHLEYNLYFHDTGDMNVELQVAPTLDFLSGDGIFVAVSFDDEKPQLLHVGTRVDSGDWNTAVAEGVRKLASKHSISSAGWHVLKVWYVDPGVVLERVIVDCGGVRPSYLGPLDTMQIQ